MPVGGRARARGGGFPTAQHGSVRLDRRPAVSGGRGRVRAAACSPPPSGTAPAPPPAPWRKLPLPRQREASPLLPPDRSGETRYNKDRILQGQGVDEPLSETGFKQADAAGIFLSNVKFTHVFSSDLLRAKQTALTIIGKNQFCKDIVIQYDARLRERKYGIAEGRPLSDLKAMAKAAGEQCPSFTPSGGETLDEVRARAKDFFEFLCHLSIEEDCQKEQAVLGMAGNGLEALEGGPVFPLRNHCSGLQVNSDTDRAAKMLSANILVVSHGAYMRNWFGYFVLDLKCTLPSTLKKSQLSSVSPNTGVSHFIINLGNEDVNKPEIICVCLNQDDHLADMNTKNM